MSIIEGYDEMNPAEGEPTATELSGLTAVDETTLEVTLNEPNTLFPYADRQPRLRPAARGRRRGHHSVRDQPGRQRALQVPRRRLRGRRPGRLPRALRGLCGRRPANVDEIDLRVYQDPPTIYTDFQAGSIDLALLDGDNLATAKEEYPEQVVDVAVPGSGLPRLPGVRRPLHPRGAPGDLPMAIDREAIVDEPAPRQRHPGDRARVRTCSPGAARPPAPPAPSTPRPPRTRSTRPVAGTASWCSTPTRTRRTSGSSRPSPTRSARNLGIEDVSFEALPIDQLYERFGAKSIDGPSLAYAGAAFPHLYALADQMLNPGQLLNVTGYDNEEFTSAMTPAVTEATTIEETTEQVQAAVDLALADAPVAPAVLADGRAWCTRGGQRRGAGVPRRRAPVCSRSA